MDRLDSAQIAQDGFGTMRRRGVASVPATSLLLVALAGGGTNLTRLFASGALLDGLPPARDR